MRRGHSALRNRRLRNRRRVQYRPVVQTTPPQATAEATAAAVPPPEADGAHSRAAETPAMPVPQVPASSRGASTAASSSNFPITAPVSSANAARISSSAIVASSDGGGASRHGGIGVGVVGSSGGNGLGAAPQARNGTSSGAAVIVAGMSTLGSTMTVFGANSLVQSSSGATSSISTTTIRGSQSQTPALTLRDLIRRRPKRESSKKRKRRGSSKGSGGKKRKSKRKATGSKTEKSADADNKKEDNASKGAQTTKLSGLVTEEPVSISMPRTEFVNGKIQLNQASTVFRPEARKKRENETVEEESNVKITSASYATRCKPKRWTPNEVRKFYRCLRKHGMDFRIIAEEFPERTRTHIKHKFHKDSEDYPALIDMALSAEARLPSTADVNVPLLTQASAAATASASVSSKSSPKVMVV